MVKKVDDIKYYKVGQVGDEIGRSARTISIWYEYAEMEGRIDELPEFYTEIGRKGTRYFTKEGIEKLKVFRDNIVYGEMAKLNRTKWGQKGKDIIDNKTGLDQVKKAKEDKKDA